MPDSASNKHFFEVDDVFANYTIVQFCGSGAYGEVYLAEDITRKIVALKVIPISSGSEVWRMELIGLRHYRQSIEDYRSLIEIMHVGETENYFYYTMEAADNMLHNDASDAYIADTLSHRLERGGRLEPEKVLELANTLLDAIEHLSEHDLAHRDIKPANIVFINGQAKLSDIGLISTTGVRSKVVGTLDFMPPELADGDPVGYGHDLFALGKVLYCALTGLLPDNYPEVPLTVPLRAWRQFKPAILKACSPDPRQRFYTPDDFRKALPSEIKPTTFLDEGVEQLRTYRKQHPIAWRLSIFISILVLGALLFSGYLSFRQKREQDKRDQERIDFIFSTIDMLYDRQLHLQRIASNSGNTARPWRLHVIADLAASARADGDWENTERYCQIADTILRIWSQDEFSFLQEKYPVTVLPENQKDLIHLLEVYSNFAATPLAGYLQSSMAIQLEQTIEMLKRRLLLSWQGPLPGENWSIKGYSHLNFVYIPYGNLPDEPEHSFWIAAHEVTGQTFNRVMPELQCDVADSQLPATRITWNDRLDFCRVLTEQAKASGTLPQGFIYRMPYAEEWMFVLHGAWESAGDFIHEQQSINDYAWYGGNSMYQPHPVGTKQQGNPEVFDLIGNVTETVLLAATPAGAHPRIADFGSSFRDRQINTHMYRNSEVDLLKNNWSGFRIVLAPGSEDYFDNNWYCGKSNTFVENNTVYEILGGDGCAWDGNTAFEWCKLLNIAPAVLQDLDLRDRLIKNSLHIQEMPILLGATTTDDNREWAWLDNSPVYDGEWLNGRSFVDHDEKQFLILDHGFWNSIKDSEHVPLLLASYPADRKFDPLSTENHSSPLILKKFELNGKKYCLLRAPVDWYTAKRLAEMLGGRLAVLDSGELREAAALQMRDFDNMSIALGAYRRNGNNVWIDGNAAPADLPLHKQSPENSLNSCFMALRYNQYCWIDRFDAFLCEF